MKKLAIALFAVVCMAMFIAPAYADDRVSLSGSMQVFAWDDDYTNNTDAGYFTQRFRIQTTINVADDVKAVMRADYTDGVWGDDFDQALITRPDEGSDSAIDIDRAYLEINKEMWQLTAGQQYVGLGILEVLDAQITGAKLVIKLPIATSLIYGKVSENGDLNDDGNNDDTDLYAINFSYDTDSFSANLFAATLDDGSAVDNSPTMYGLHGSASLGMVDLTGELAFADGDTANGAIDYMGTQFYLRADANLSDAFSLGTQILYALGTDDLGETQLSALSDFWDFTPSSYGGPLDTEWELSYELGGSPFDPTGNSAGVQGLYLFAKYNLMSDMSIGGQVGYLEPEEDSVTTVDSITTFNAWASYNLATNTDFVVGYFYSDFDDDTLADENYNSLVARLKVNF